VNADRSNACRPTTRLKLTAERASILLRRSRHAHYGRLPSGGKRRCCGNHCSSPACFAIRAVFVSMQHKKAFGQKTQAQCILDISQGLRS
jgi:hypothetical protein